MLLIGNKSPYCISYNPISCNPGTASKKVEQMEDNKRKDHVVIEGTGSFPN